MSRSVLYGPSLRMVDVTAGQGSIESVAEDIAIHRGTVVTEAMFHMAAIRSLQTAQGAGAQAMVTCEKARVQLSTAQRGQQAAHLLPGQIRVGGRYVWELATHKDAALASDLLRLQGQMELCFAWVNVLPAAFNKADSEAEGNGQGAPADALKPLFGSVVQNLWRTAVVDPARPLVIDRRATLMALGSWFTQLNRVYADAAARKAARGRQDEARVLSTYASSFKVANPARFLAANAGHLQDRYRSLT